MEPAPTPLKLRIPWVNPVSSGIYITTCRKQMDPRGAGATADPAHHAAYRLGFPGQLLFMASATALVAIWSNCMPMMDLTASRAIVPPVPSSLAFSTR